MGLLWRPHPAFGHPLPEGEGLGLGRIKPAFGHPLPEGEGFNASLTHRGGKSPGQRLSIGYMTETMRFGIIGTGGVGGYFGGLLARAGLPVCFIARGSHLQALKEHGLAVDSVEPGQFNVRDALFTDDPAEAGPCDVILYCVKTPSNDDAIPFVQPMIGPNSVIISLQNGVDNGELLAREYGGDRVMEGAAYVFSTITAPGKVHQTGGPRRIVFGRLDGGPSSRGEEIVSAMRQGQVTANISSDIRVELWNKFILICAVGGMTALTRRPLGDILDYDGTARMARKVMREVYQLALAMGIPLEPEADVTNYRFMSQQHPSSKGSMCHDVEAGRRLEIDSLCGYVSRMGRIHGVATPLNDYIYDTLKLEDLQAVRRLKEETS